MGGEKLMGRPRRSVGAGSPPRRRGKALHRVKNDLRYGITPAWAGKSTVVLPTPGYLWDHPRVGGEKLLQFALPLLLTGSPPRGRGKGFRRHRHEPGYGIIPAWAGKREPGVLMVWQFQDHPRVGGEKILEPSMGVGNFGSPPHGRGKVVRSGVHRCCRGITPAWAGKRCSSGRCCMRQRDHPRVGGEKTENITPSIYEQGSPPRRRGKVPQRSRDR